MTEAPWEHLKVYGYAPGNYMNTCCICKKTSHDVDKRAITCRPCAERRHLAAMAVASIGKPAMTDELPPPDFTLDGGDSHCYYATTVHAAIAAAVARERERCADICEQEFTDNGTAQKCAAAIRKGE